MATKTETIKIEPLRQSVLTFDIVGDSPLILNKKARSFEMQEIFKQSHPKGTAIPDALNQPYCLWERLITSVAWENPVEFHDDDYSLYTEEQWEHIIQTNRPCILSKAWKSSWCEAFKSFWKDKTGKNGTDFERSVNICGSIQPVDFTMATYSQHLTPNTGMNKVNVLAQHNIFNGWRCSIEVRFVEDVFPKETIIGIIQSAGTYIGIGTKRKEEYGRYHIENVKITKIKSK